MKSAPANIAINLLPKDPFFDSILGRVLQWALSGGRYIVIITELVVIVSFAARFTLDRQVTDLNQAIFQKEAVIDSLQDLEVDFLSAQAKLASFNQMQQESNHADIFAQLQTVTPQGINLSNLIVRSSIVNITGNTFSQSAFNIFVTNLQLSPIFSNVTVDRIESEEGGSGFQFKIRANIELKNLRTRN